MAGIGFRMLPFGRVARAAAVAAAAGGLLFQHAAYAGGGGSGFSGQPHEELQNPGLRAFVTAGSIDAPILLRPSSGRPVVGAVGSTLPQVQKRPGPPPVWRDALTAPARRPVPAEDVLPPVVAHPAMSRPEFVASSLSRPPRGSLPADSVDAMEFEIVGRSGDLPAAAETSISRPTLVSAASSMRSLPAARRIPVISWAPVRRPSDYGDLQCLAEAIYFEARGEGRRGWKAIDRKSVV